MVWLVASSLRRTVHPMGPPMQAEFHFELESASSPVASRLG